MPQKPYATLRRIGQQAVVYEACFLPSVKASHALHFISRNGVHAYVDVSEGDPVALKFIHKPSVKITYQKVPAGKKDALKSIYRLAVELILLDKLLKEMLQDATNSEAARLQIDFRGRLIESETHVLYADDSDTRVPA